MVKYRSFLSFGIIFLFITIVQNSVTVALARDPKPVETVDMAELLQSGKIKDRFEGRWMHQ